LIKRAVKGSVSMKMGTSTLVNGRTITGKFKVSDIEISNTD
jgi:hypothetical protein